MTTKVQIHSVDLVSTLQRLMNILENVQKLWGGWLRRYSPFPDIPRSQYSYSKADGVMQNVYENTKISYLHLNWLSRALASYYSLLYYA
jgi:hypothetical protein